jgi:hypothetical protein
MYAAVPRMTPTALTTAGLVTVDNADTSSTGAAASMAFDSPKSSTFTDPSGRTLMLAGFRSR